MTDSRVFRVRRHSPCGYRLRLKTPCLRARGRRARQSSRDGLKAIRRIGLFCGTSSRTGQGAPPHGLPVAACSAVFLVHRTGKRAGAALSVALFCTNGQATRLRLLFRSFSFRKEKGQRLSAFSKRGNDVLFLLAGEKNEKNARPFRSIGSVRRVCFYTLLPTRVCAGFAVQATAEHAAR